MDGTATASRTSPRARRLTFARRVCVLVSLLLITPPFHGVAAAVLLVGPLVLAPAGYELSLLFACASVFLSVASWMTRRSGGDSAKGPVTDGKRAVRWLANGITVLALSASILVAGFECLLAVPYIADRRVPRATGSWWWSVTSFWRVTGTCIWCQAALGWAGRSPATAPTMATAPWTTGPTRSSGAGQSRTSPHTVPPPIRL